MYLGSGSDSGSGSGYLSMLVSQLVDEWVRHRNDAYLGHGAEPVKSIYWLWHCDDAIRLLDR